MIYNSLYLCCIFSFFFFCQEQLYASSVISRAKRRSVRGRRIPRLESFRPINDSRSTGTGIAVARDKARETFKRSLKRFPVRRIPMHVLPP